MNTAQKHDGRICVMDIAPEGLLHDIHRTNLVCLHAIESPKSGQIDPSGPGVARKPRTKIENGWQGKQLLYRDRLFDCNAPASQLNTVVALETCLLFPSLESCHSHFSPIGLSSSFISTSPTPLQLFTGKLTSLTSLTSLTRYHLGLS